MPKTVPANLARGIEARGIEPLQDYENFQKSLRNFHSWLQGVVSGASDIDLLIERRGQFLVAELKPWTDGVTLPYGQHLAIQSLAALPQFQVYLVGESDALSPEILPQPATLYVCSVGGSQQPVIHRKPGSLRAWYEPRLFRQVTLSEFQSMVREWWAAAS